MNNYIHFRFEVNFTILNGQRRERGERAVDGSVPGESARSHHTSITESELVRNGGR